MNMDARFVNGSSDNLPSVDVFMIAEFMKADDRFTASEIRGSKALRSSREDYGDKAIGYVQLKREGSVCTVKRKICPEHRVRSKAYSVTLVVDENAEKVLSVDCHDCAASSGGCKHALAFLMWVHRRNEDKYPTDVACYWKKPTMAGIGISIKFITAKDLSKENQSVTVTLPNNETVLEELITIAQQNNIDSQLSRHSNFVVPDQPFLNASIYRQLIDFCRSDGTSSGNFLKYISNSMKENVCREAEVATRDQSKSPLWHELRFGRITASKLYEVARCKTAEGVLVGNIIGAAKVKDTSAMKRGRLLEKQVLQVVENKLHVNLEECGLLLMPKYPILGASPDAISKEFVVEIKCPTTEKAVTCYISDNKITNKFKAQIHLQMLAANKKKGVFCVAKPDFEQSKEVTVLWVDYDKDFIDKLIEHAMQFWSDNIFSKLLNSVS